MKNILFIVIVSTLIFSKSFLKIADSLSKKGKYTKAEQFYKKALKNKSNNKTVIFYNMGNMYYKWSKMGRAISYYEKCIDNAPNFKVPYLNIGRIYYKYGEYYKALKYFDKYYKINQKDMETLLLLGDVLLELQIYNQADRFYKKAQELTPTKVDSYLASATLHNNLKNETSAIYELEKSNGRVTNELLILHDKSYYQIQLKNFNDASITYSEILNRGFDLSTNDIIFYNLQLAECLREMGYTNSYLDKIKSVVMDYPKNQNSISILSSVFEQLNRKEEKIDFFSKFYSKNKVTAYRIISKSARTAYDQDDKAIMKKLMKFYENNDINSSMAELIRKRLEQS